jgi:predicted acylesterase/phospholipase RssA
VKNSTIFVLVLTGGGTRGYLGLKFLQRFLAQWGIPQVDLWKYATVIGGASIGGILDLAYAYGLTPDQLESFFLEKACRLFTIRTAAEIASGSHNANTDSNRPNTAQKLVLIGINDPFYKSPYPDSNYGDNILQQTLVDLFGTSTMASLKTNVVIPSFQKDVSRFVMFSNFNDPMFIGQNESIVNVARATSAAPIYLPHFTFNGHDHVDGGLFANDPAQTAVGLAKSIKPNYKKICVLDLGTGKGHMGFDGSGGSTGSDNMGAILFSLFDISMSGSEELSNFNLTWQDLRTLDNFHYYKFQPSFPSDFPHELDNSTPSWFNDVNNIMNNKYNEDSSMIADFIGHLTS